MNGTNGCGNEFRGITCSTATLVLACMSIVAVAEPTVVSTHVIGPFTGHDARMHPDNLQPEPLLYYGTDLGFSYEHAGQIVFLFGDTWASEAYSPIEASTGSKFDDGFGTVKLADWPQPEKFSATNVPTIRLGRNPGTNEMSAMDPGHAMDLGKTPMGGFSNGKDEFAIFNTSKPQGCRTEEQCGNGLRCDTGLGYYGVRYSEQENLTLPCIDGMPLCIAQTMNDTDGEGSDGSGFCVDKSSTAWANTQAGRVAGVALNVRIGLRSKSDPRKYGDIRIWRTNKYLNVTARTVERFVPDGNAGMPDADYRGAKGAGQDQRVFLWGRPGFVGVSARGRTMGLYFAYADLPEGPGFSWKLQYYAGQKDGIPQFSPHEIDAQPLDLDSTEDGIQPDEVHDLTHQMSVAWVEPLGKWLMFYGGGITRLPSPPLPDCGVLELFARFECRDVVVGNGAIRMRTADDPWGPWSPPQDVIAGGDPALAGTGQYIPGGVLHHPQCEGSTCATHTETQYYHPGEYGFFYGANIVEQWTRPGGDGVDIIWNASTWDPYRVVLLRSRINP